MNQRFLLHSNKAYLQLDFAFALLIFLLLVFSFLSVYSNFEEDQINQIELVKHQSLANDFCFILSSTPGSPSNWYLNPTNLNFIGLLENSSSSQISPTKLSFLLNQSNFLLISDLLNFEYFVNLKIYNLTDNSLIGSTLSTPLVSNFLSSSRCYSNYNNTPVSLLVEVWS